MKKIELFVAYWLPPIAWMSLIFCLSSIPGLPDFGHADFGIKKLAHFLIYAALYFLSVRAFHAREATDRISIRAYLYAGIVAVLFAMSDEVHQRFVPMRDGNARDVLIDSAGMLCMGLAVRSCPALFRPFLRYRGHLSPPQR